jgi:AcrR family transcriptional regulator
MTTEAASRRGRYHHGQLRAAMVEAAVQLLRERGAEHVTVREAARRAGVSSGAPFRHFPTRAALMTAVAEEALRRFRAEIDLRMAEAADDDPLVRLSALARAYLSWAVANPTFFAILGDRGALDLAQAPALRDELAQVYEIVPRLLAEAADQDLLRSDDLFNLALNARTMAYGLARMFVDRQLPEWGVGDAEAEGVMAGAMRHYLQMIARRPDRHAWRI